LNKRLVDKNYKINFDKTVINRIYELNSQEEYGARPLKRIIQNLCEDFLSEEILRGTILENVQYTLKYKDENLIIKNPNELLGFKVFRWVQPHLLIKNEKVIDKENLH